MIGIVLVAIVVIASLFFSLAFAVMAVVAAIVMVLWDAIIPGIFHIGAISLWQAAGILLLCRLLFGSFRGRGWRGGHGGGHRRKAWKSWNEMSSEERATYGNCRPGGRTYYYEGR